ncbi:MAG: ergothioneine biosynthesis protein EgtB [Planctomycetota bacterium]
MKQDPGPQSISADPGARPALRAESLLERYREIRSMSDALASSLSDEDCNLQSMPDASPVKWNLAHTSWFFETFVLRAYEDQYEPFDPSFAYLFNSYYAALGDRHARDRRGIISRPGMDRVRAYRFWVDERVAGLLRRIDLPVFEQTIELGLQHEQQHQELLLTDIKHAFACNPLRPTYQAIEHDPAAEPPELGWLPLSPAVYEIGHNGAGFAYDNESPRHRVYAGDCELSDRLVTNGEYLRFMQDGGYERQELWLDDGWSFVQRDGLAAPLYWRRPGDRWVEFTMSGEREVDPAEPVCHISFFEADAYARWAHARLPTEAEWEAAFGLVPVRGHFASAGILHPMAASADPDGGPMQVFGDCWEWTGSPYRPYPGYRPPAGAIGEYNGKFMNGKYVLKGGSCFTPEGHVRPTYRNFFTPESRWQAAGIRLARDPA